MTQTISFGEWLKRRRKSLDLTRDELARRVPCSVSAVWRLETNDLRPSPTLAESIARVLNIPANQCASFVAFARGETNLPPDAKPSVHVSVESNHLPAPLTQLIGRRREVSALVDLLRQPSVRLLTLTGPPGTGKTRLSIAVGQKVARVFRDGVHFVALEPITDPTLVAATIAQTLGVKETRDGIIRALTEFLRDKNLLLIVDNFEHLIPAAPLVTDLLTAAPQVKALVTSREILHLYGEHEFPVPPLELLDVQRLPTTQSLTFYSRYSSIQFFKERARAAKPDFRLTTENAADVARICAWVDGLPLAIEIAAAQVKWHTATQLLAQLSQRLDALTGGPRDLTPRQQSLRGAIDWSYDLLDEAEKRLFDWLGIFVDGCAEEAISDLSDEIRNPKSQIQNLVEKSLVRHELDAEGSARYTMLETMREYARAKLAAVGELERAQQWHAEYYLKFAQEFLSSWRQGGDQARWLHRVQRELNNLRAALAWSIESSARVVIAQEFAIALNSFWHARGYLTEARRWLQQILALDATPSKARATMLACASDFAKFQGDYASARIFEEEGLAICQALGDQAGIHYSLEGLGMLAGMQGDYARAAELLEQVLEYRRQTNDRVRLNTALNNLALATRRLGNLERAQQLYAESVASSRQSGNENALAHALQGLGDVQTELKAYAAALDSYRAGLAIRQQQSDLKGLTFALDGIAVCSHYLGDSCLATQLTSTSEKIRQDIGLVLPAATLAEYKGFIAELRTQLGDAAFERAWAEGQVLSVEQAVALANETK
ncbi:MAG: tetratricopeptide repeat protein [Chloroflexi bacterium]|nr:tetratricopeptide repeat protein [Chloroflexota bacterium]